jgi:cytoskeletal protein CcmA (bactofilin family)
MVFNRRADTKTMHAAASSPKPAEPVAYGAAPGMSGAASEAESIIGNDLAIEGQSITIRCQGSLRVNGNIQADLHGRRIIVGEEATIRGSIAAEEVEVLGHVNGEILGASVVLHSSADVEGDIHSQHLSLERGASFNGRARKVSDPAEIAPQLVATSPAAQGPRVQMVGGAAGGREVSSLGAADPVALSPPGARSALFERVGAAS